MIIILIYLFTFLFIDENLENNTIPDGEEPVSSSLKQQSNKLKKIPPRNAPEQRLARLEDGKQYHSIEPLHEDIVDEPEQYRGPRRPSATPARYESFNHSNDPEKHYYQQPQPLDPNNNPLITPIRKSYSYDQQLSESNNAKNMPKRSSKELLSRSPEAMKSMPPPPVSPKQNYNTGLHRSHSNGLDGYPVNSPISPSNNGIPPRSPNFNRLNHSRSRSPSGNVRLTNNINHMPIPLNSSPNFSNLSKSLPANLSSANSSLNNSNSTLGPIDNGIRYYSELSAYELITVKHMAINVIKENLDNSVSLDLSSLIEDRKLKLWEKVFVSFKSNQKKTKPKGKYIEFLHLYIYIL